MSRFKPEGSRFHFSKKVGFHRGNPRIFFETDTINVAGFVPGARYDAEYFHDGRVELRLHPKGTRAVVAKQKGDRVLSVIDLNGAALLQGFVKFIGEDVLVIVEPGLITIAPPSKEK